MKLAVAAVIPAAKVVVKAFAVLGKRVINIKYGVELFVHVEYLPCF